MTVNLHYNLGFLTKGSLLKQNKGLIILPSYFKGLHSLTYKQSVSEIIKGVKVGQVTVNLTLSTTCIHSDLMVRLFIIRHSKL